MFGAAKSTKNADPDKYRNSGYGVGIDVNGTFSFSDGSGLVKTL